MARSPFRESLADAIAGRTPLVAVVGLGYVGLPLAVAIARSGFRTVGIDTDTARIAALQRGESPIDGVDPTEVQALSASGRLGTTSVYDDASGAGVGVIAVPTPIDAARVPDLRHVTEAARGLLAILRPPALLVLESTVYPGATEELIGPAIRERGLLPGHDVFLAYSPERIDPGNEQWTLRNTPKLVAGLSSDCQELALAFYGTFVEQLVPVSNLRTAETAKLFENTFRMVNIALANEFQVVCDAFAIDAWEALGACNTKPYGFMAFQPGPGLGGHCIPVDPFYLAWKARQKHVNTEFIELAGRINDSMPTYVVGRVTTLLNDRRRSLNGSRVAVLGAAYKRNSSDVREAPAIRIIELLLGAGAIVTYHDPHVESLHVDGTVLTSQALSGEYLAAQESIVVVTDHDAIDWTLVMEHAPRVVDCRNALGRLVPSAHLLITA